MHKVKIRLANQQDTSVLIELFKEKGVLRWFPMTSEMEVLDAVRLWMGYVGQGAVLAAEIDGKTVGLANLYLSFFQKLKHQALFAIIVDQKWRSQGIGTKLLQELEKLGKEKFHLEFLHLEVYQKNPAIHLYQRMGFVEYGRHKHFIKEEGGTYLDKIMMQKKP